MQGVLWSVSVDKLDVDKNKSYVITQSLNYGNDKILVWLFKKYSKKEIVSELINPMRGVWYPQILNYWQKKLNITIPQEKYKKAIKSLYDVNNNKNVLADD